MIKISIAEAAQEKKITTAYALQKALNISPTIAARLWRGDFDKIGIGTLDKLCRVLKCQPNKLFKYEPDGE
jgi:DNA-binding Xre family transcriptional regulator